MANAANKHIEQPKFHFHFMEVHKIAFFISGLMMVMSMIMLFTRGLNLGIDFTGGMLIEVKAKTADVKISDIRAALDNIKEGKPTIQEFNDGSVMLKIPGRDLDQAGQKALSDEIKGALGDKVEFRRVEYVGPQVGQELVIVGIKAFVYSLIGIMIYIWFRFEWQFGLNGVVALAHDVCASLLFLSITKFEFDLSTIAAVLLVAGYSINDTVIVFDRIREMLRKHRKMDLGELLNLAINQTLSRTIKTSMTTLLALIALLMFGSENIHGFTSVMLVGILVGTYSSIFIAAPILLYMNVKRDAI